MFDVTLLILLGLAALGFISHNTTVAVSILVLIIVRVTPLNTFFPWIEKQGLTVGIIILTIGVMAPIASGTLPPSTLIHSFVNWKSLVAIAVGVFRLLAGRSRHYADGKPTAARRRAAGRYGTWRRAVSRRAGRPLIAAGLVSLIVGKQ
ncbi:Putative inner membrane protein [Salmonella enterica subsp. enterica]|uniref:Inner membrane protein n=1 Tax=Salmonella enterica I TaxID=59201 RepID=A0A447MTZ2_SALET|nr:Putative inner membrane protein [Salmonella enterica subsp. enterica]